MITLVIAVVVVALFVVSMSLTLIFKGHHIDSEISTNRHMQERGIKCAVQEQRDLDARARGQQGCPDDRTDICASRDCASCTTGDRRQS
ncbi:MAG: hypothetical protein J6K95_02400 [Rikenellaceae bacterium]|nr:hypothetical protein [Rikenellaceae bacterium]